MSTSFKLVAFSKEQPARLLTHYLTEQGFKAKYQQNSNDYSHTVMLMDESELERARVIAEEFLLNPNNQKYQNAAWQSGETVNLNQDKSFSVHKVLANLYEFPFTATVLIVCLLVYSLANIGVSAPFLWLRIQPFEQLLETHQWWRILGPAFLHFSVLHIAFNLLWWWSLGKQIEKTFGLSSLLLLFVFSAALSNIAQLLVNGPNFGGLSGVVYALVGCVWWLGVLKPSWGVSIPKPIVGFLLIWLVVGYMDILPIHMANTAHTLGLVSGCLFAWFLVKTLGEGKKISSGDRDI